jgi:hypothetical protein
MLPFSRQVGAARRQVRNPAIRLAYWGCFLGCLILLTPGCGKGRRSADHVEVSGKVLYKGKPVTGGMVTFTTTDGFSGKGIIDENGNYSIKAPVGQVKISVDNTMVGQKREAAAKGAGRPAAAGGEEAAPVKGKPMFLPRKFLDPLASGLTYTVTKDSKQTHNIEMND